MRTLLVNHRLFGLADAQTKPSQLSQRPRFDAPVDTIAGQLVGRLGEQDLAVDIAALSQRFALLQASASGFAPGAGDQQTRASLVQQVPSVVEQPLLAYDRPTARIDTVLQQRVIGRCGPLPGGHVARHGVLDLTAILLAERATHQRRSHERGQLQFFRERYRPIGDQVRRLHCVQADQLLEEFEQGANRSRFGDRSHRDQ